MDTINEEAAESHLFTALVVALSSFVILYPVGAFLFEAWLKRKAKLAAKGYTKLDKLSSLQTLGRNTNKTSRIALLSVPKVSTGVHNAEISSPSRWWWKKKKKVRLRYGLTPNSYNRRCKTTAMLF